MKWFYPFEGSEIIFYLNIMACTKTLNRVNWIEWNMYSSKSLEYPFECFELCYVISCTCAPTPEFVSYTHGERERERAPILLLSSWKRIVKFLM